MTLDEALANVSTTARDWEAATTWEEGGQRWEAYTQARVRAKELGATDAQIQEALQATCEHHWHWISHREVDECCRCKAIISYRVC